MKATFLLPLMLLLGINAAKSQITQRGITGIVIDSINNKPPEFSTLILKNRKNDSTKRVIAKADGVFTFLGLKPVEYLLTVVAQGFKTRNMMINLENYTNGIKNLGTLYMVIDVHNLEEVVVTENKLIAKQEVDRIVYNVQADPESKSSNILEMMRKVPLLSVDGDNIIRLKGNTNYKIFINGKPSTIVDRNPQDILRNMPAAGIDKVEIITTVPAKYDAEALDGIINLVTTKRTSDGYLGNANVSHRFLVGGPGGGGSATIKEGKFGISAFLGGNLFDSPSITNTLIRNSNTTSLSQRTDLVNKGRNAYMGTDISYEFDSLNLISGQLNMSRNHNHTDNDLQSLLTSVADSTQRYKLVSSNVLKAENFDASLNYQVGFKQDKNRLLTFSYRILKVKNDRIGDFDLAEEVSAQSPNYKQSNDEKSLDQSFQIDYFHPFRKLTLEAGVKGIIRKSQSDFLFDPLGSNQIYGAGEEPNNEFNNTQDIIGIYTAYQYKLSTWGFKAGIRLEHATIDANFISNSTDIRRSFFDYIPSISIQRQLRNNTSLLFGYSRKVRRPEIQHLNPFEDRSNPNLVSSGNPDLRPASSNSLEVSYSSFKKMSLYIRFNYDFFSRMVMPTHVYDVADELARSTLRNTGYMSMFMSSVYVNYPFTSKWNVIGNLLVIYGQVNGLINNTAVSNQRVMYYFSASSSYRFNKGLRAIGSVNLNGADINLQGIENSPYRGCTFSITKELMSDKCYFTVEANNPFSKYRNNTNTTKAPDFYQERTNQRYIRSFSVSLSYRFGGLKSSLKKSKKGIANDDNGITPY